MRSLFCKSNQGLAQDSSEAFCPYAAKKLHFHEPQKSTALSIFSVIAVPCES